MLMPAVSSSPGVQSCLTGVSSSLSDILYKPRRANFCMLARFVAMPKGATPDPEEDFYFCTVLLMGASQSDATRAEVVAPAELRDEENTTQPWSSEVVKARLVRLASEDDYTPHMRMLSDANPQVAEMLGGGIGEQLAEELVDEPTAGVLPGELDNDDVEEEPESRKRLKKSATVELLLCILLRSCRMHAMPFFIAILSVLALKSSMSENCWGVFTLLSVQFNSTWAFDFCVRLSALIAAEVEGKHSQSIRLAVFDNCSYMRKNTYQSEDGDSGMLHTVNWLRIPLDVARYGAHVARGAWHNGSRTFSCRRLFAPNHPQSQRYLLDTWLSMMQLALRLQSDAAVGTTDWCLLLLTRPSGHATARTFCIYMDPVLDVGTAAYADVDQVLKVIFGFYFIQCSMAASIVLLVGDQQSYNRLLWQKKLAPDENDWYVPLPGEFHFVVHVLMAIHRLWFVALSSWARDALGWDKTIKEEWTSVEEWHHYDRFYLLLIAVLTAYLLEIVPAHLLLQPAQLRDAVDPNASASIIVRFLYEFGYPYLALRNAIRANDHASSSVWPFSNCEAMSCALSHTAHRVSPCGS